MVLPKFSGSLCHRIEIPDRTCGCRWKTQPLLTPKATVRGDKCVRNVPQVCPPTGPHTGQPNRKPCGQRLRKWLSLSSASCPRRAGQVRRAQNSPTEGDGAESALGGQVQLRPDAKSSTRRGGGMFAPGEPLPVPESTGRLEGTRVLTEPPRAHGRTAARTS